MVLLVAGERVVGVVPRDPPGGAGPGPRGDEPAEAKRLVDYARDLAFEVVCAGKGKNNPLNPHATPAELTDEAKRKGMNPKMLCSFVDGSKAMIEMASLANTTGLEVSKRGMYGPPSSVQTLSQTFRPASELRTRPPIHEA